MEVLLVVTHHDDQGDSEGLLQILGEDERQQMAQVHGVRRGASPGVEIEWLALFVVVQEGLQVSLGEEDLPPEETVHRLLSELGHSLEQFGSDGGTAELLDQNVVVYLLA